VAKCVIMVAELGIAVHGNLIDCATIRPQFGRRMVGLGNNA
jgi:hypothetical protein